MILSSEGDEFISVEVDLAETLIQICNNVVGRERGGSEGYWVSFVKDEGQEGRKLLWTSSPEVKYVSQVEGVGSLQLVSLQDK